MKKSTHLLFSRHGRVRYKGMQETVMASLSIRLGKISQMMSRALTRKVRMGTRVSEVNAGRKRYTPTPRARESRKYIQWDAVDFFSMEEICANIARVGELEK